MPFDVMPGSPLGDPAFSNMWQSTGGVVPYNVDCLVAIAICEGLPASIGVGITVNCSVATASGVGLPCSIIAVTTISCGVAEGNGVGLPASITLLPLPLLLIDCAVSFAGTEDTIPLYDVGDALVVKAHFTERITGVDTDPSALSFRLRYPDDVVSTSIVPTRTAVGLFEVPLTATMSGVWRFTWLATGVAQDGEFSVSSSLSD